MFAKLAKNFWLTITFISTVGGAAATYQLVTSTDEYSLTLYKKNEEKLIERNKSINGLTVAFQGKQLDALYSTEIELGNTGRKALTRDFIFQSVTLTPSSYTEIVQIKPEQKEIKSSGNNVVFTWDLLNPGNKLRATILSTGPIDGKMTHQIREVPKIEYIDEVTTPPRSERLKAVYLAWLIAALTSIALTIDAIGLIRNDAKLQAVFDLPKSLIPGSSKRADFLNKLLSLYKDYYVSTPRLLVTPKDFEARIVYSISESEIMSDGDIKLAQRETIDQAKHANLYSARSINIVTGPLLFGICVVRVVAAIL